MIILIAVRTLSLNEEHMDKLETLMIKFMGVLYAHNEKDIEIVEYEEKGDIFQDNWLYITMVILPQYIGDWHLDANWMVTHMTAKTLKHPIDYLYEKYIENEKK